MRICRECGCHDEAACVDPLVGPCWWVAIDLCSHCAADPNADDDVRLANFLSLLMDARPMTFPDAEFRSIPVEMAAQIGADCHKDQVIVLSFDRSCDGVATATWGNTPQDKITAARLGQELHSFVGGDLSRMVSHADFRHVPAAEAAARIEALLLKLEEARSLIEFMQQWYAPDRNLLKFWATWEKRFPDGPTSWAETAQSWLAATAPAESSPATDH